MDRTTGGKALLDHFAALDDPRRAAKVLHPLPEIMLLLLCATLAGADDFVEIQLRGTGTRRSCAASAPMSTGSRATTRWAR